MCSDICQRNPKAQAFSGRYFYCLRQCLQYSGLERDFESPKQGAIPPVDGGVIMPGISTEETAREESSGPLRSTDPERALSS